MTKNELRYVPPFVLALSALGCNQIAEEEKIPQRPNIVFIMSDDHAYQAISAYSDRLMQTPNIDRIANEGMLFNNACVTNSISGPSRATILTGKHSHINGKIDNKHPFDTTTVTFPQILQDAGYQTALFGKLHFGNNPKGFDQFKILPGQGDYYNPDFITKEEGTINVHGYVTDIITDMTLDWLDNERNEEEPFMLMYWHKAPHREWLPALRHVDEFTQRMFEEPETLFEDNKGRGTAARTAEMNLLDHMHWGGDSKVYPEISKELGLKEPTKWGEHKFYTEVGRLDSAQRAVWDSAYYPLMLDFKKNFPNMTREDLMRWRYQRYMQDYLGTIASVDEGVGQVLDYLEANGLSENTIVVYTSDQGFYLGEYGWYDKRFIYNESFKTPLLIRWPAVIAPGTVNNQMVQNLDFAQTFLEAAGIDAPEDMQGESLVPIFNGDTIGFRDAVYYHFYEYPSVHMVKRHYGVVTENYKLAHFYYDVDEWELYDRKKDTFELNNVYHDPAYADVVTEMKQKLADIREYYQDSDSLNQYFIDFYKEKGIIKTN